MPPPGPTNLHGHRGLTNDPLYRARRTRHTGDDLLTEKQTARLKRLFAVEDHVEVEATCLSIGIYQGMVSATATPTAPQGGELTREVIDDLSHDVPAALNELRRLGRTLKQRAEDVLVSYRV